MVILRNDRLEMFKAVCDHKTIHAAASKLGLTQAAATKRIQALEEELGVSLFLRSRRGMTPTPEGDSLLQLYKQAGELEGQFAARIGGREQTDVALTLTGPTSAISTRVAANCEAVCLRHPYLRLHLRSDDQANRVEMVKRGEADLAIVSPADVPNEMQSKLLKPDRYLLVATHVWKNRDLKSILRKERIIDFDASDPTTTNYLAKFGLLGLASRPRIYVNENEALIRFFAAGIGYGTLTDTYAAPHLKSGRLCVLNRGQTMEDPLALIWYPRSRRTPYLDDLIRSIK